MRLFALFRLAFAPAPPVYGLTLPHPVTRRLIKQKARGHPETGLLRPHLAPTACKHTVSGSISLPSPGFFSPFPHGTGFAIGDRACLALPSGLGRFKRGSTCPALLRYHLNLLELLCTGLSPTAAGRSSPVPLILHNLLFHQPRTKDESFVRGGWWWWPYNPDR